MIENEELLRDAFSQKDWQEIKANDTWQIFKIMSEFVEGFEKLARIGPCVSIFGSARTKPDHKYYELAEEIAYQLTQHGYGIITGGGPGIMEAGNLGAKRGKGKSVGVNIDLPFEQEPNMFIDADKLINFDYLFESLTLIQTMKIAHFPIVLVGKSYWTGLFDWVKEQMLHAEHNISSEDLELVKIVDTADEAVYIINDFYSRYILKPNF